MIPGSDGGSFVNVDGASYHIVIRGNGPVIVFPHGFLSTARVWSRVIAQLNPRFRCISIDLPRFGRSAKGSSIPTGVWSRADWLHRMITTMETGPATIVGTSMGGQPALAFSRRYPEHVRNLVLNGALC